ncbi:AlbA family DNA-binding domain-containing protein [Allochromatium palmeri]|uniref:AAA family ATPase n=1 Tax=Allochromatium palmeri TaxID=231048 RepID=A0A6N8EG62_9GAMM|nr:helix-turn-helix domain-containing protein [Allochromatium palmeri]MTW21819.1 AAA family ATPase [Allochromatium palmeri]
MTRPIAQLIQDPESKTLEFKRDLSSPRPFLKTLVAFANSAGGRLILGVSDDRRVLGIEDPLDEEERLGSLIADSIAPRLVPNIELTTVEGKTLLVVEVFLSGTRPHYLKAEGRERGVYVRLGSSNRQADAPLIVELQRGVAGVSFDALPMPDLSLEALDLKAIQKDFSGRKAVDERMLQSLRVLVKDQNRLVPSHGGMLLYGLDRRQHFDDAWIQCGRFIGNDKADIFDHLDIHDPLPKAVDEIMLFLKKHAMRGADFSEIRRKDIWSIPVNILREVVINALVHADYSHRGTPIRIAFFDNRIEVESPGLLLPGLTVEDMKLGVSQIRNPVIARVFRELDLVEQWGSGIPGIYRQVKAENLPEPTIEELAGRVRFTVPLQDIQPLAPGQSRKRRQDANDGETDSRPRSDLTAQVTAQVTAEVASRIGAFCQEPRSAREIMEMLGLKHWKTFQANYLNPLLASGVIERTIPDKPSSRLQKYRITEIGKDGLGVDT